VHIAPLGAWDKESAKALAAALEVLGLTFVDGK